jgi:hypothetical protein
MAQGQEAEVALLVKEIDSSKIMLSEKKVKTWNFKDASGKVISGSQTWGDVYYGEPGKQLMFTVENVRTTGGVMPSGNNMKKSFMSVKLSAEQSEEIKEKIDKKLFDLMFAERVIFMKNPSKIKEPANMSGMFQGVVKEGPLKSDGSGECWPDELTADIPMKKVGKQPTVNSDICVIEDLSGSPYAYTALSSCDISEVVVQVDRIVVSDTIKVKCSYRVIVPKGSAPSRVMTKRKLDQRRAEEEAASAVMDQPTSSNIVEPPTQKVATEVA